MKRLILLSLLSVLAVEFSTQAANAQRVRDDMKERSTWYKARKQYQIVDERPIISDFREAPAAPGFVDLPPGPEGAGGGYGSPGGGAMGDPGSMAPPGGVQIGGPNQGYRTDHPMMGGPNALPKSGFGRHSNIPARGLGPKGPLPGVTQGVLGKLMTPTSKPGAGAGAGSGTGNVRGKLLGNSPAAAQTYSGGYGSGSGAGFGGSASRTESNVRGRLLNAK